MDSKLSICTFFPDHHLQGLVKQVLQSRAYNVSFFTQAHTFIDGVSQQRQHIDCLVLESTPNFTTIFEDLQRLAIFLPSVVIKTSDLDHSLITDDAPASVIEVLSQGKPERKVYDAATIYLEQQRLEQLPKLIDQVINRFLKLPPDCTLPEQPQTEQSELDERTQVSLLLQQKRLAQKLKERLGYLGIYYKRDPANFLRRMQPEKRQTFLAQLRVDYRKIVLNYFSGDTQLNQKIDNYVSAVFFADVPTAQVVEIHMELMDDFSKQLKIEGRSEEILLDYRLTLIDTLANLCEMYRRSIPREP